MKEVGRSDAVERGGGTGSRLGLEQGREKRDERVIVCGQSDLGKLRPARYRKKEQRCLFLSV
jgi:hypothetical protein